MPRVLGGHVSKERLFYLDAARALAIVLVTSFHVWRDTGRPEAVIGPGGLHHLVSAGFLGVDVFFVVSGFAMMLTWESRSGQPQERAKAFLASRFWRIYPPYLAAVLFWIAMAAAGLTRKPVSATDIVSHLTMTHTFSEATFFSVSGVLWSLAVESHFYVLFPLVVLLAPARLVGLLVLAAIPTIVTSAYAPLGYVWSWNVVTYFPLFIAGMMLFRARERGARISTRASLALLAAAAVALTFAPPDMLDVAHRSLFGAAIAAAFLLADFPPIGIAGRIVSIVGQASYSIYLYNYAYKIAGKPMVSGFLGIAVYSALIIAFGVLMWRTVERPLLNLRAKQRENDGPHAAHGSAAPGARP